MDDNGCRIYIISDGNEEIVTNQRYVVMPWNMVTRYGTNMTLKEACEEDRKLVYKFEAKHRDEIDEILGLIGYIDKGYIEEKFPEIYKFGPKQQGIHLKDKFILEGYNSSSCQSYNQLDYFKRPLKHIRAKILIRLNMLKRWRPS